MRESDGVPQAPSPPEPPVDDDTVRLRIPADPGYARIVRVAVSALGVRLGLAPATVDDLRLAVDESLILLLGRSASTPPSESERTGATGSVEVTLLAPHVGLPLTITLRADALPSAPPGDAAVGRFHELIPSSVEVVALDPGRGEVVLRHPVRAGYRPV